MLSAQRALRHRLIASLHIPSSIEGCASHDEISVALTQGGQVCGIGRRAAVVRSFFFSLLQVELCIAERGQLLPLLLAIWDITRDRVRRGGWTTC